MQADESRFLRIAGRCALAAPVASTLGWFVGGLVQPAAYSPMNDDISQLGAETASSPWLYNQVGANLSGLLVVGLGVALWRALSPDVLGRLGAGALIVAGAGAFLDGLFRLDCQSGVDPNCVNNSWHADAHKLESKFTAAGIILSPLILAFAFRRLRHWHDTWIPTLLAIPASLAVGVVFSLLGNGAGTRATTLTWFLWLGFVAYQLLRKSAREGPRLGARHASAPS